MDAQDENAGKHDQEGHQHGFLNEVRPRAKLAEIVVVLNLIFLVHLRLFRRNSVVLVDQDRTFFEIDLRLAHLFGLFAVLLVQTLLGPLLVIGQVAVLVKVQEKLLEFLFVGDLLIVVENGRQQGFHGMFGGAPGGLELVEFDRADFPQFLVQDHRVLLGVDGLRALASGKIVAERLRLLNLFFCRDAADHDLLHLRGGSGLPCIVKCDLPEESE